MKMVLIQAWVNDKLIQALCWTLLHSLWQGLAVAVLAGVVVMTTRKSAAGFRYNLFVGLFILFIATTGFTFLQVLTIKKISMHRLKHPH